MKRLLNVAGGLLGLLALIALVFALALTFGGVRRGTEPAPQAFQSPIETPTLPPYPPPATPTPPVPLATPTPPPYPPPGTPTPQPTPRPTSTRPPPPPTRAPTPTFTPAPPTLTPEPLPTLIPGLHTFVYATTGEKYPEIYRAQLNPASRVVGPVHRVHTPELWRSRTHVFRLHPSPDGKRVAIAWAYGDGGGNFVSILHVNSGEVTLLPEGTPQTRQIAVFLGWSPDGNSALVFGSRTNADLDEGAWLIDVRTQEYREVDIKPGFDPPPFWSTSFSPDGKAVVYAQTEGYREGSKVWRLALDGSDRQLLYEEPERRVEDVLWSPDGSHIAFTQWLETENFDRFAPGELWVMKTDGSKRRLLSPAQMGYGSGFTPVWSPDGRQIAFIKGSGAGKELKELSSNGYVVDIRSGEIRQLTDFHSTPVLRPAWLPDGSAVTFIVRQDVSSARYEPWVVAGDGRGPPRRLDESARVILDSRKSNPIIVWLPASARDGQ